MTAEETPNGSEEPARVESLEEIDVDEDSLEVTGVYDHGIEIDFQSDNGRRFHGPIPAMMIEELSGGGDE